MEQVLEQPVSGSGLEESIGREREEVGKKELGETGTPTMRAELPKSRSRHRRAEPPRCTPQH